MAVPSITQRIAHAAEQAAQYGELQQPMLAVGRDGLLLYVSPEIDAHFRLPLNTQLGKTVDEAFEVCDVSILDPDAPAFSARPFAAWCQQEPLVFQARSSDGRLRTLEGSKLAGLADAGNEGWLIALRDVSAAWRRLSVLAESERRFRRLADASRDMVTETDDTGRFVYLSAACEQVLGYTAQSLVGTQALDLHHPDDVDAFVECVVNGGRSADPFSVPAHRLRHRDGHWVWVEALGISYRDREGRRRVVGVARDVSEQIEAESVRRQLAERVLRSQKLESLGAMAGGIAHDFNNLLTPIVGNVGLALLDLPADSPIRKRVEMIKTAADRATALTRQLLAYAGQGVPRVDAVNISTAIEEMALLLESTAASSTRIRYDLQHDVPLIEVDSNHIGQVVMNLVANASESLPATGGQIEVRTGSVHADQAYLDNCYIADDLEKGLYVYLEVADDGPGIPEADRDRIFDPFFTTRFIGRGLGLAAVDGIVRGYRGALELMTEEGQGTRIRVLFPTAAVASRTVQPVERRTPASAKPEGQPERGTVLVVDDDENACAFMADVLDRAGYRVIQAAGGAFAVKIFERHGSQIDAVVLDYTMPLVSGAEVFDSIRSMRPDARVLLVSGYAQTRAAEALMQRGLQGFLQKPFEPGELVREVDQLLEA